MPLSRKTLATAPIRPSVLFDVSFFNTEMNVRSGNHAAEDLRVLDLTGHHRGRDAGLLQETDAGTELAEGDPVNRRPVPRGRGVQLGEGLFLDRDDRDVVPERASRVEHEEREPSVAGKEAEFHEALFVGDQLLGAPGRAAQDDAALRTCE